MAHKTKTIRCAIYTRKSSEEGLEQEFNSLHAQREACEAYIKSQRHEGWTLMPTLYDDGGFSGGSMDRPALTQLIADIKANTIDIVVVYKVDRLSRSLSDFVQLVEMLNDYSASFVSVTQQFNTSTSMGRLTLNVLLSFAQFEREVTGERIRDKIAASKQKGMWMGGCVPLGYDLKERELFINKKEAEVVKHIYEQYLKIRNVKQLKAYLDAKAYVSKVRISKTGKQSGSNPFTRGMLYSILKNPIYIGKIKHKKKQYEGRHKAILALDTWQQAQDLLAKNNHEQVTRSSSMNPSLLSGQIFDDKGFSMSPVQAKKRSKHYRYYVSQALMQYKDAHAGSVTRISAGEVEAPVLRALIKFLRDSKQLLNVFKNNQLDAKTQSVMIDDATILANSLIDMPNIDLIVLYRAIIERVVVSRNAITVDVSAQGMADVLKQKIQTQVSYQLHIPAQLKRCGLEMKLIIEGDEQLAVCQSSLNTLQASLSKGLCWHGRLMSGQDSSINQIAKNEGVTRIYVLRRVRMAYLAPDIIKAIISGQVPQTMNFSQIKDRFPLDWGEQRSLFGF